MMNEYLTDPDLLPEDHIRELVNGYLAAVQKEENLIFTYCKLEYYKTYFCIGNEIGKGIDINRLLIVACYHSYIDGKHYETKYLPLMFRNLIIATDGTIDLNFESGEKEMIHKDPDEMVSLWEAEYTVVEIYIEYE